MAAGSIISTNPVFSSAVHQRACSARHRDFRMVAQRNSTSSTFVRAKLTLAAS